MDRVSYFYFKIDILDQTAGADHHGVVGVDVGTVLGDLGVVRLLGLTVAVGQLRRGGCLPQPCPVPAVVVTPDRAAVALLGDQGGDVLVVRTCQFSPENSHSQEYYGQVTPNLLSR